MEHSGHALQVIQITDMHLRKEPEGTLLGMNTRESLDSVLQLVQRNHPRPDVILVTGDIAQDGSAEAYRYFRARMAAFGCPVFWFAGNHDQWPVMQAVLADSPELGKRFETDTWQLVFLNSAVPGKVHGFLPAAELDLLNQSLSASPGKNTLVCLHHHPVDTGCAWLNPIGLHNRDAFFAILDRHPQVRGVVWGHIHQEMDQQRGDVRLLATPSTSVQFAPHSAEFSVGNESPGYRWLELQADGRIDTGVVRADHIDFEVDYDSQGY